ncbi:MAG: McrB family protein [Anaerolineae bacterium]
MDEALERAYESTLTYTAKRFGHWARSNLRPHNIPEIAQAVFDTSFREQLLSNGIKAPIESEGRFSEATFDLLEDLHRRPRLDFYMEHREDFEEHLIKPFKHLFTAVAEELPARMKATLETESRLFSRIPKNDFGQGGAWDHYWAAFYPKGGKRTSDVQLALWINYQMLKVGFSFGAYSSEGKKRFLKHCEEHREALVALLQESFDGVRWVFGASEQIELKDGEAHGISMTWKEWLSDPEPANASLGVVLPRQQAVGARFEELRDLTLNTYERLFPLVLLATEDDPIPAIIDYLESGTEAIELDETNPIYPLAECAEETGFNETDLARWVRAIERKGQAIFYGPPGTGKTFIAEHLAKHIVGGGHGIVELVQFHPAYAYEDFIQGIRPQARADGTLSYDVVSGRFLDFCERASTRKGRSVLIIDEINRANLSRVFGELMYLLEYRRKKVPLAGGGTLSIPQNVRIIGTMNTADRSIALVDHALRRRFAFLALAPNYEVLRRYHRDHETGFPVQRLIGVLRELNVRIGDPHYYVGITFFLHEDLADAIEDIWEMEIVPYLEEYFFDQADQVQAFRWSQIASRITGNA